jgi:protein TonB
MFESFSDSSAAKRSRKSLAASTIMAAVVYAGAGSALVAFAATKVAPEEKMVEVSFEKLVPKKALPPPPPPPPKVRKVVAAIAAPRIEELIAPKEVPKEKPPEQDPSKAVAQGGSGDGIPGGQFGGGAVAPPEPPPPPPPPKPKKLEPINLPEEAEVPVADPANIAPGYPEAARAAGIEGRVILKIVISEKGEVTNVTVMRGDPILAQAAVEVVKTWKFTPATLEGKPIAVFRIVPINFSSKVGGAG